MTNKTALYNEHVNANAKLVDFSGWDMPLHYGSQIEEHHQVRQDAGMFDVSHMTVVDIKGEKAKAFLQSLLANDVAKLKTPGKALYSCMLNESGGVIDDLIVYYFAQDDYRLVVNAGTRAKDLAWITKQAQPFNLVIKEREDLAMIAIQGPNARSKTNSVLTSEQQAKVAELKPFQAAICHDWLIARTGYTGEDGYEIILPNAHVCQFWQDLLKAEVKPCGLGARDTLRLEAGLNLYGQDMDETVSPFVSNLAWTVAFEAEDRLFIGRKALENQRDAGVCDYLTGLILEDKGVLRVHQKVVVEGYGEGEITSGTFSPTMGKSIALARIPRSDATYAQVDIRGKWVNVRMVNPPFVRNGKIMVEA